MSDNSWYEKGDLPQPGIECEYYRFRHNDWKLCRIEFIGRRVVVMSVAGGSEFCRKIAKLKFRPIKTEREIAIAAAIKATKETVFVEESVAKVAGILFDAGLLRSKNES